TIGVGGLRQIVEFQARREYEGMGAFPNFRGAEFRAHLDRFRASPMLAGVSVWATNGGFLYHAPVFYRVHGEDAWIDANVYAYSALARDPALTPEAALRAWLRDRMGLG